MWTDQGPGAGLVARLEQIKQGSTTKDNIIVLFGQPEGKEFAANGDEAWTYGYILKQYNPNPLGRAKLHISNMTVTFDNRGIVKAYKIDRGDY
jgi:outer membrane protein assembly factor BamE (lipoprotein component of BamABCDE complex)